MPLPYSRFCKTTTIVTAPSDSVAGVANGRDPLGCALVNASYDHTGGATGERQLTAPSGTPFSAVLAGDLIYLLNAGGGIVDGLYAIASVPTNAIILLAADSGLTADSTSDVDSSDGPWASIQYMLDRLVLEDIGVICDDGNGTGTNWEPTVTLDIDTTSGANTGIDLQGATGRGVVDYATQATISGASLSANVHVFTYTNTFTGWRFNDLRVTGATGTGAGLYPSGAGTTCVDWSFFRCRFDTNGGGGVVHDSFEWSFVDCEIDGNGNDGVRMFSDTNSRGGRIFIRCRIHDNTDMGIRSGSYTHAINCLIYDNTGSGIYIHRYPDQSIIDGCVFHANDASGISSGAGGSLARPSIASISNSVFRSNGAYGVNWGYAGDPAEIVNCCFSNNTSGSTNGIVAERIRDSIYVDPQFTSETDGSEDFTPATGSPLIDAGIQVPVN